MDKAFERLRMALVNDFNIQGLLTDIRVVSRYLRIWPEGDIGVACCRPVASEVRHVHISPSCGATASQLTTDGLKAYLMAVEETFGADIDFAQLVKLYGLRSGKPVGEARQILAAVGQSRVEGLSVPLAIAGTESEHTRKSEESLLDFRHPAAGEAGDAMFFTGEGPVPAVLRHLRPAP